MIKVDSIDHIVLTVTDIKRTIQFYCEVLGMVEESFEGGRKALRFGSQKFNLHLIGGEYPPFAKNPIAGSQDICLITKNSMSAVVEHLTKHGINIIEGPGPQTGALGDMESVYFSDPDGNLIEVSNYL